MPDSGPRASRAEIVLLVALAGWALFPLVLMLVHASQTHTTFTGADGLIGADGVLGADQLQYLAWARDAGAHGLASDLFTLAPSGHVYLEPLFTITGALWRLGLSLQLAYLVWKPLAIVALFVAAVLWARRFFGARLGSRTAVVVLALFLFTPLAALFSWAQLGQGFLRLPDLPARRRAAGGQQAVGLCPERVRTRPGARVPAGGRARARARRARAHERAGASAESLPGAGLWQPGREADPPPGAGGRDGRGPVFSLAASLAGDHADPDLRRARGLAATGRRSGAGGRGARRRTPARLLLRARPHRRGLEARRQLRGDPEAVGGRAAGGLRPAGPDRRLRPAAAGWDPDRAGAAAVDRGLLRHLLRK